MKKENEQLPAIGFLRLSQVLRLLPVSKTSWYDGIKEGIYPPPVRIGKRSKAYRAQDIRVLIDQINDEKPQFEHKKREKKDDAT